MIAGTSLWLAFAFGLSVVVLVGCVARARTVPKTAHLPRARGIRPPGAPYHDPPAHVSKVRRDGP